MDSVKAVKRHNAQYDIFNRLHSIASDQAFVQEVSEGWYGGRFEVVPNQRCGTWYCPPNTTYAYFKSTDGHTSNWNFNLRRANLSLASYAEEHAGLDPFLTEHVFLLGDDELMEQIDSGRLDPTWQDALSKTIPIWCSVINRAVARRSPSSQESGEWDELYLPAGVVSPSEREQIIALLPTWTESLLASGMTLPNLKRPLRPFFLHPSTTTPPHIPADPGYTPIICLSVSRWVGITGQYGHDDVPSVTRVGERNMGFEYVPGAGDDDELWAKGLTPRMFWRHRARLLALDRGDLEAGLQDLQQDSKSLEEGVKRLELEPQSSQRGDSATSNLTGVPTSGSRLAVDLGRSVIPVDPWTLSPVRTIHIWVFEVAKSQTHPETIYTYPTQRVTHIGLALPSPKADSWGYKSGLIKLVSALKSQSEIEETECSVIVRPASSAHLDQLISLEQNTDTDIDIDDALEKLEGPEDIVSNRKFLVPILLLLLCTFTNLQPKLPNTKTKAAGDAEEEVEQGAEVKLDKGHISTVLLTLVALWPDGNPPRAALKRVNEILLSSGKH